MSTAMEQTITKKTETVPNSIAGRPLAWTMDTFMNACGYISFRVYETRTTDSHVLREELYSEVR